MPNEVVSRAIDAVCAGDHLTADHASAVLTEIMEGRTDPVQTGAFLIALRAKGETADEVRGFARAMRELAVHPDIPEGTPTVDTVGTGGDSHGTFNVSTCAALVAAGAGAKVAKHGNRSVSSKSGASDVLGALGVKLDITPETVARCIDEAGVGFMWAPMHHAAMKHWAPVRAELGIRTIFNVLGPICNPANVRRQIVGVYARELIEPIANVLKNLGAEHVWVVHGHDGMDELTTTGSTSVAELKNGEIRVFEITPADAGLQPARLSDLVGGDAEVNAAAIRRVLAGEHGPFRDIVVLNAGAALVVAGLAESLEAGVAKAAAAIDSGAARAALERLIEVSNAG